MNAKTHVGFWLSMCFVLFLAAPMLRSGQSLLDHINREVDSVQAVFGVRVTNWLVSGVNNIFASTPLGALAEAAQKVQRTKEEEELGAKVASTIGQFTVRSFNSYFQGIALLSFVMLMRLGIVALWAIILLPFIVAAVNDGFVQRTVKRHEMRPIRPAAFSLASFVTIPMLVLPAIYIVAPFSINPALAPIWGALVALPLSFLIANTQPIFGK